MFKTTRPVVTNFGEDTFYGKMNLNCEIHGFTLPWPQTLWLGQIYAKKDKFTEISSSLIPPLLHQRKVLSFPFFLINLDFYWYYTDITNKLSKILTFLLTVLDFKKYWKKDWYLKPLNLLILEILRHVLIILIIGHWTYFLIDTFWGLQICPSILNENPWVKDTMWSIWKKYLRGPFSKRLCRSHTSQMTIA